MKKIGKLEVNGHDIFFYSFICPTHGKVENHPSGHYENLICPHCQAKKADCDIVNSLLCQYYQKKNKCNYGPIHNVKCTLGVF